MFEINTKKAIEEIKKQKAKTVLIQLPEGLKQKATEIADEIEKNTDATCFIWLGTCFGSCDIPEIKGIDLLIHFGHFKGGYKKQIFKNT